MMASGTGAGSMDRVSTLVQRTSSTTDLRLQQCERPWLGPVDPMVFWLVDLDVSQKACATQELGKMESVTEKEFRILGKNLTERSKFLALTDLLYVIFYLMFFI